MSCHLFSVLLLLIAYCVSGPTHANGVEQTKGVDLFVAGETMLPFFFTNQKEDRKSVDFFRSPSLVEVDGVVVAVAEAQYRDDLEKGTDIGARYMTLEGDNWETQLTEETKWGTQVAMRKEKKRDFFYVLSGPRQVVKDKKIYLLVGSDYLGKGGASTGDEWVFELVIGSVTEDNGTKTVKWGNPTSLKSAFQEELKKHELRRPKGGAGSAIVMSTGELVFLVEANKGDEGKTVSAIIYSKDDGKTWKITRVLTEADGQHPSIVEWEGKLLVMTSSLNAYRKVYESSDIGATWTEAVGSLSRVWGNSENRVGSGSQSGFITADIDNKKVMLFTQPVEESKNKYRLHLWLTDNKRILDVGSVSVDVGEGASSLLLYSGGKLLLMYERPKDTSYSYFLTPLTKELQRIKSVLSTWSALDGFFSRPCDSTHENGKNCDVPVPTGGLVGFLSNNGDNSHWGDAYLCVNATVNKAKKVPNGFEFNGLYSGARWPVSQQGQNQRYHFANYGFTLVATVFIHEVPNAISPLLGLGLGASEKSYKRRLALWYDENKRWKTTYPAGEEAHKKRWEPGKMYQVALMLEEEKGYVYVDGQRLGDAINMSGLKESTNISHFVIGREKDENTNDAGHVTVTDVFLYSRPLNDSEFQMLLQYKERRAARPISPANTDETGQADGDVPNPNGGGNLPSPGKGRDSTVREFVSWGLLPLLGLWAVMAMC